MKMEFVLVMGARCHSPRSFFSTSFAHILSIPQHLKNQSWLPTPPKPDMQGRKLKRTGTAARGLRSLVIAIFFPLSLTVLDIFLFGSGNRFRSMQRHSFFPPMWALHSACLASTFLSGLAAWLVWADGGFHRQPGALILYLGQIALSLGWYPIVFGAGAIRVGLVLSAALFGLLIGCSRIFENVNPIAGDLFKPCLLWGMLLATVNVRLVYQK